MCEPDRELANYTIFAQKYSFEIVNYFTISTILNGVIIDYFVKIMT